MTLVNLMNTDYIEKIECDKPQRDGYEVINLIEDTKSTDGSSLLRLENGFVVDTFVRTPVNIKIYFKFPFKLEKIQLNSKVNRQESNGFQIQTSIEKEKPMFKRVAQIINNTNVKSHEYIFEKRKTNDQLTDTSVIVNRVYFGANPLTYLDCVHAINISIIRTLNATSACLKSLKILGVLPSHLIKKDTTSVEITLKETPEIPEEYLDELTNDLMIVPVQLPSGHVIDKSTLDLYLKTQRENGVFKETDPFSKIDFSSAYKVKINEELKAKIDHFRLANNIQPKPQDVNTLKRKLSSVEESSASSSTEKAAKQPVRRFQSDKNYVKKCLCCQNDSYNLYQIDTCKHAYCRHCLISIKNVCIICKIKFDTKNVVNLYRENFCRQYKLN